MIFTTNTDNLVFTYKVEQYVDFIVYKRYLSYFIITLKSTILPFRYFNLFFLRDKTYDHELHYRLNLCP